MRISRRKEFLRAFAAFSSILGIILLWLLFVPYSSLKSLGDHLVADGELESLTPYAAQVLRIPIGVAAASLLLAAAWAILFPESFSRSLSSCLRRGATWLRDAGQFASDLSLLRLSRTECVSLAIISCLGLAARLMLLNRSVEYDEAYTVMAFARSPFRFLISDYHVPNNHIFHSLLVRVALLLLGSQPWQIRMPVLIAGMLLIPFVYWLGRALHGSDVGCLSAAIVAFLPHLVQRSVAARGYVIVALLTVMAFLLVCYLLRRRNLFAWSLLVMLCAIGFYTVPIMLFPFGFLSLWMLMSTLVLGESPYSRSAWILHVVVFVIATVLVTAILYSPVVLVSGFSRFFPSSGVLASQTLGDLLDGLPYLASAVVREWFDRLSPVWPPIFLVGMLLSGVRGSTPPKHRLHTAIAFFPAILILLLAIRPNPLSRIWLWAIPFGAIWVSSGLGIVLQGIQGTARGRVLSVILLVCVVSGLAVNALQTSRDRVIKNDVEFPAAERVAALLAQVLTPKSVIAVDYGWDAFVWYYLYLQGIDRPRIFRPHKDWSFDEVYALTGDASCDGGHVLRTLEVLGPDPALLELREMREVAYIDPVRICWIPAIRR